ncbi:MAG: DUF4139 domain-containing protein [Myxococcaceae bacterium]
MSEIATRVDTVTLYHRGATVRRVAEVDCPGGKVPAELSITGLPLSLYDATVRLRVEPVEGRAELVASNVRVGLHVPPRGTPAEAPDLKELRRVQRALELSQDSMAQLESEVGLLRALPVPPRPVPEQGKIPPPSPMSARTALEQLTDEGVSARVAEVRALRETSRKLEEEAGALLRRLELASTAGQVKPDELTKAVHATLTHRGAQVTRLRLSLEYFVAGARWAPAYQCRMARDCREAELVLRAQVCQLTGEDWAGVKLVLSTAAPLSWTELPELSAIRIGKAQPALAAKKGFRPPPQGAGALFADFDRDQERARAEVPVIPGWAPPALELPQVQAPALLRRRDTLGESKEAGMLLDESEEVQPSAAMDELAEEPMPPPSPAPMRSAAAPTPPSVAPMAKKRRAPGEPPGAAGGASLEVMLYAQLRLGSPAEATWRSKLQPVDRAKAYLDSLAALGAVVTIDVMQVVALAERQGERVYERNLPTGTVDVRSAAGHFDFAYRADAAVDVPSDGSFHSVPVGARSAPSEVLYVAVPREDSHVYRQAMVKNPLAAPLLPGPAEVYVGDEYVLTTALPAVPPGGDFRLGLGVEQAVKVARNARYQEQRSGDKVVATSELIHDLDIDLVNNLQREVQCEVRERIPQPAEGAEVVVEEGKVEPAWEPYDQEDRGQAIEGGRRWRVTVAAGKSRKLSAQYRVKLYANNELVGGNRREA